jgi:hypothetical protein
MVFGGLVCAANLAAGLVYILLLLFAVAVVVKQGACLFAITCQQNILDMLTGS